MKALSFLLVSICLLLLSCGDNVAPTIKLINPIDKKVYSNNVLLDISFNLWGASDLSILEYSLKNSATDSIYFSGDWKSLDYSVDFIVVNDYLNIPTLPAGQYTFKVQVEDESGNSSAENVQFSIVD